MANAPVANTDPSTNKAATATVALRGVLFMVFPSR